MKTILLLLSISVSFICNAQDAGKVKASGSGTCTCQPGQSICQAEATFMSCCTCCEAGSSCGSWTAFGLCGCACEKVASTHKDVVTSQVRFYFNKYNDFMSYLDQNNISSGNFRAYAQTVSLNRSVNKTNDVAADYIVLEGNDLKAFTDSYINDMKILSKNANTAKILDSYLNKK